MPFCYRYHLARPVAIFATAAALVLSGCGIGMVNTTEASNSAALHGTLHGGPNPVVGATIRLYSSGSGGYGSGSSLLASTTTDANGNFTFPANSCFAGTEVYATAAAGNTGANTVNNNSLLMAALGDCANINSSTTIWIDEITTVAAAYALRNFTTTSGSGPTAFVTVGAPSTNGTGTPACTGTGNAMSCTAAGLKHAFANALNIASSVSLSGVAPTGAAYTTTPSNPNGTIPTALINLLGNVLQACVNSTGGASGDATACGNLFLYTTPPATSTTTPVTPTTTLQAMLNLAQYPTLTAANVTSLFGLASATGFYQPALTAAPLDYSLAIVYKGVTISATTTTFGYPYYVSLDISDNVYATVQKGSSTGPVTVDAMTSNGSSLFASGSVSGTACSAGVPCSSEPDTNGTLWVIDGTTSLGNLYPVSTATGVVGTGLTAGASIPFFGIAIDRTNAVFVSVPTASAANSLYSIGAGGSALSAVIAGGSPVSEAAVPAYLFFDQSQNLWNMDKYTAATSASATLLPNTGVNPTTFGTPVQTVDDAATANGGGYGVLTDSNGVAFSNGASWMYKLTQANTVVTPIRITNGTINASSARYGAIDGSNNIFYPDNSASTSYIWQYLPGTGNFVNMLPCAITAATTVCASGNTQAVYGPRNAQVDSTGSIWIVGSTNGNVVQVLSAASPAWPQLSYAKPGAKP